MAMPYVRTRPEASGHLSLPNILGPGADAGCAKSDIEWRLVVNRSRGVVMSTLRNLPKTEWRRFFDRVSKPLIGKRAEIEVAALDLGDQIVAEWVPLIGITYDSQDDLLDVALDRANRLIRHPREILVE